MKTYKCGLCKPEKRYVGTRMGLRKHLKEEHRIMSEITNRYVQNEKIKQVWWIAEEK